MTDAPVRIGMSLADFLRRSAEGRFELVDGEIVPLMPAVFGHSVRANTLQRIINDFARPRQLGEAFVEANFVKPDAADRDWVEGSRIPDVLFVRAERLAAYTAANPDWEARPLALIPDLVVEIVSPNHSYSELEQKIESYLADGVRLVWVLDPPTRSATVHTAGSNIALRGHLKSLSGADKIMG